MEVLDIVRDVKEGLEMDRWERKMERQSEFFVTIGLFGDCSNAVPVSTNLGPCREADAKGISLAFQGRPGDFSSSCKTTTCEWHWYEELTTF